MASASTDSSLRLVPTRLMIGWAGGSTPEGCQALADAVAEREEKLHILVNNAGATWGGDFDTYSDSGFSKIMELNVHSIFSLTRDVVGLLEAAGTPEDPARVINIGSMDGLHVNVVSETGTFAYAASKAAAGPGAPAQE